MTPSHSWQFTFEGQFLGFTPPAAGLPGSKVKYFTLGFAQEQVTIKLPKTLRTTLGYALQPGDWLEVQGTGKLDRETGNLKLKAAQIRRLNTCQLTATTPLAAIATSSPCSRPPACPTPTRRAKILVCQKSGCLKRGGKALLQAIEAALQERNLDQQVVIERTGCLKRCSSAPNFVLMPGKHYGSHTHPEAIGTLIEQYFKN